ncbi:hypothetical protein ABNE16_01930 [Paenibacillus larvae]
MIIDYHEAEQTKQGIHFSVGVHFEDEPDSYYVILIDADLDGRMVRTDLNYNGMDCKYTFTNEEKHALLDYLNQQEIIPDRFYF